MYHLKFYPLFQQEEEMVCDNFFKNILEYSLTFWFTSVCLMNCSQPIFLNLILHRLTLIQYHGETWIFDVKLGWTWLFMSDSIKCVISEIKTRSQCLNWKTHKPRNLIKWIIAIFERKTRKGAICKFDQMMIKPEITLMNTCLFNSKANNAGFF